MSPTTLTRISLDVLALITERLDGVDTLILAQTCPQLHRSLLLDRAVTKFQVCARKYDHKFRWPKALTHLARLTHFSLCLGRYCSAGTMSTFLVQPLPKSLQVLRLQFREAEAPFALSPLELSLVMLSRKVMDRDGQQAYDLVSAFPNLHTLELHGDGAIRPEAVGRLPPTLTKLVVTGLSWNDAAFSALPRGLTYLRVSDVRDISDDGFVGLPPTLRFLNLPGYAPSDRCWTLLPTAIEKFVCSTPVNVVMEGAERNLVMSSWYLRSSTPLDVLAFPRSLTEANFIMGVVPNSQSELIAKLPKTLTRLRLRRVSCFDRSFVNALPRALTRLTIAISISDVANMDFIAESDWPQQLQTLSIDFTDSEPSILFFAFPPQLTSLECCTGFPIGMLDQEVILPPRLTFLRIAKARGITRRFIASFPKTLVTLYLQGLDSSFDNECLGSLPNQLTTLHLDGSMLFNDDTLSILPRSVTDLHIDVNQPTDLTPNSWISASAFRHLPRSLKFFYCAPVDWSELSQNNYAFPSTTTNSIARATGSVKKIVALPSKMQHESKVRIIVSRSEVVFWTNGSQFVAPLETLFRGELAQCLRMNVAQSQEIHIFDAMYESTKKAKGCLRRIDNGLYLPDEDLVWH